MNPHEEISKILKEYRKGKGLTQIQLAELSGISVRTIGKIEKGEPFGNLNVLEAIFKPLGIVLKIDYKSIA